MKHLISMRLLTVVAALGGTLILVAAAQATVTSHTRAHASGALVALKKTALGTILVDAHGRTLYLFEKDRNGTSACTSTCASYWPALTSRGTPRAANGVHQSLLGLTRARSGARQVTYHGHPLYTFVGDKRAGATSGEGLDDFGAEWYAVAANGHKVERSESGGSGSSDTPSPSPGYGASGGGW